MTLDHTSLVYNKHEGLFEYPVSEPRKLLSAFSQLYNLGVVYGYIENRRQEFKHKFYGWGLQRL
jgi:3-methyladenine DNA glycosylase Tag